MPDDPPTSSSSGGGGSSTTPTTTTTTTTTTAPLLTSRQVFNRKRSRLLSDMILSLDLLTYALLAAIYAKDVSFLRLLLRCLVQFTFLTPKPASVPSPPRSPPRQPLLLVLLANAVCLAVHLLWRAPVGGEATRGYLHGGLAMDFVGEKGGTNRLVLAGWDLLVCGLQVVGLGALKVRERAKSGEEDKGAAEGTRQTLEAEESGVLVGEEGEEGVELRDLGGRGTARGEDEGPEEERGRRDVRIFDAFNSGEIVVADLCLSRIVKLHLRNEAGEGPTTATSATVSDAEFGMSAAGGFMSRVRARIRERAGGV